MKKSFLVISLVILFCFAFGCQQAEEIAEEPSVDIAAETDALKEAFQGWTNAIASKDAELMASFWTEDVVSFHGDKEASFEWFNNRFSQGLYSNNFKIVKIEISASGDMGYIAFTLEYIKEEDGNAEITGNGYNVQAWKKQADGTWKQVAF